MAENDADVLVASSVRSEWDVLRVASVMVAEEASMVAPAVLKREAEVETRFHGMVHEVGCC